MQHSEAFVRLVDAAKTRIAEISIEEFKRRAVDRGLTRGSAASEAMGAAGRAPFLIDVREDHEVARGRIPKAVHIGRGVLERDIDKHVPDPAQEIVLYCGGGDRSALAADNLRRMGYAKVFSLAGGFGGWKESGGKVEP